MFYFFLRARARGQVGEGQRERKTESEAGSQLWAVSTGPDARLESTDREITTWSEVRRLIDWATQVPLYYFILKDCPRSSNHLEKKKKAVSYCICLYSAAIYLWKILWWSRSLVYLRSKCWFQFHELLFSCESFRNDYMHKTFERKCS